LEGTIKILLAKIQKEEEAINKRQEEMDKKYPFKEPQFDEKNEEWIYPEIS